MSMRKLLLFASLLLPCFGAAHAATYYACAATGNMDTANFWGTASTGNQTCSGSDVSASWPFAANGDVFDANGATVAVDVDPGAATGASAGVCGSVTVTVTLQSNATYTGGFTYATATNIVMHANVTGSKSVGLTNTGSTGGGTICGNTQGGSVGGISTYAVSDAHTSVTIYVIGSLTGGTANGGDGYYFSGGSGSLSVTGNATGAGTNSPGLMLTGAGTGTITGNCTGSATSSTVNVPGCWANSTGALTVIGNIINNLGQAGATGRILYKPAMGNYILYPADSSYTTGVINSHATLVRVPRNYGTAQ